MLDRKWIYLIILIVVILIGGGVLGATNVFGTSTMTDAKNGPIDEIDKLIEEYNKA